MKNAIFILFFCACSGPPEFESVDAGPGEDTAFEYDTNIPDQLDTDSDGGLYPDTDADSDTDDDSNTDTDTGTDADSDSDTGSDSDVDTDTDTSTGSDEGDAGLDSCPWDCSVIVWEDPSITCDSDTEDPEYIRNYNFDCPEDHFCCQPLGASEPGALDEPCPWDCHYDWTCDLSGGQQETSFYCALADAVCCYEVE